MKAFTYQPNLAATDPAPVTAPQVAITNGKSNVAQETPVTMSSFRVSESAERKYREVRDAMAYPDLTKPHALYTRDLSDGMQFEAIGAPIDRTWGESVIAGLQPRFPLVGLNF